MSLIPNIKVEVTFNQLCHVSEALSNLHDQVITKSERATVNILELLSMKLLKKQISKRHEKKAFKITFEYYEAYFLEKYLLAFNKEHNEHYIQTVIDKLNQKLA